MVNGLILPRVRESLEKHIEEASTDLTNYITKLGPDPLVVFLDNTFKLQSALLITTFTSIHQQLSMYSKQAQKWLEDDLSLNNIGVIGVIFRAKCHQCD